MGAAEMGGWGCKKPPGKGAGRQAGPISPQEPHHLSSVCSFPQGPQLGPSTRAAEGHSEGYSQGSRAMK